MNYYLATIEDLEVEVKDYILDTLDELYDLTNYLMLEYSIDELEEDTIEPLCYYYDRYYSELIPYDRDQAIALADILEEDLATLQAI